MPSRNLNIMRKPLLVALLDSSPLLDERRFVHMFEETLELRQILQERCLGELESLGDELGETRVALIEPATRSD